MFEHTLRKKFATAVGAAALLVSTSARAQEEREEEPVIQEEPAEPTEQETRTEPITPEEEPEAPARPTTVTTEQPIERDWVISVGAGLTEFTGDTADGATDLGAAYDARVTWGANRFIGWEAAYVGSTQDVHALGVAPDASLLTNGAEVLGRVNLGEYVSADLGPVRIAPFAFVGAAYHRFELVDEGVNTSNIAGDDNVFAIPLGAGVFGSWGRLMLDARFTWRETIDEDLFRAPTGNSLDASLSNWNLTGRIGLEF